MSAQTDLQHTAEGILLRWAVERADRGKEASFAAAGLYGVLRRDLEACGVNVLAIEARAGHTVRQRKDGPTECSLCINPLVVADLEWDHEDGLCKACRDEGAAADRKEAANRLGDER